MRRCPNWNGIDVGGECDEDAPPESMLPKAVVVTDDSVERPSADCDDPSVGDDELTRTPADESQRADNVELTRALMVEERTAA